MRFCGRRVCVELVFVLACVAPAMVEAVGIADPFAEPLGPRTWYETGTAGIDMASGVVCDSRGSCAWSGHRTLNGKPAAVVRVHHP